MPDGLVLHIALTMAVLAPSARAAAPAFPGAEGWGRNARGGGQDEKTKVLLVTSVADAGPGTLREALNTRGPRIIIFKTGGIIDLKSRLSFSEGRVTVAGQTAPGDGIILKNYPLRLGASDVIIRGLRVRNGDGPGPKGELRDGVAIGGGDGKPSHDIIIDHCSFGWSVDEAVDFWYGARDVTLSYNIISEALWKSIHHKGSHGYAMLIANGDNQLITVHHNLFAHNERRNPWVKDNAGVEIINNVIYNWGTEATGLWLGKDSKSPFKPCFVNVIGNYYKGGEATLSRIKKGARFIDLHLPPATGSRFYIHDNLGPGRTEDKQDDWDAVDVGQFDRAPYRVNEPAAEITSGLKAQKPGDAYESVLKRAGAVPRDNADTRAVADTRSAGGRHIDRMEQIGGYPAYAPGTPAPDADGDGMPDEWERAHRLDPNDKADATKFSAGNSGYLNIEEYINSLFPDNQRE